MLYMIQNEPLVGISFLFIDMALNDTYPCHFVLYPVFIIIKAVLLLKCTK